MAWRARELGKARFLELSAEVMTGGMLVYRFTIEAEVQTGEHGGSLIELAEPLSVPNMKWTRCATTDLRINAR